MLGITTLTIWLLKDKALHKQVFFYTLINYLGTAIGIVSVLFIYPLDTAFLGTVRYVDVIAQTLFPIMVLGASHALIKFYPALDESMKRQLFNYSMLSILVLSALVFGVILIVDSISDYESMTLFYYAFPIAVALAFVELFRKQAQDLQKLTVPTLYEKIIPKLVLPAVFLLLVYNYTAPYGALSLYMACYLLVFILTAIYLFRHFRPGFTYRFTTLFTEISKKDYYKYSAYSFAASLGSLLAFRIDAIFIYNLISDDANGIFSMGVTLASTLQIPAVGLFALYAPLISNYLKTENFAELRVKYKEGARLLFFIGALLYGCIFLGIENLFLMLPSYDKLVQTVPVIFILGFSVLLNMATGFNTEIIAYSKFYRFNMIAILSLVVINVVLNLLFIYYTNLGIVGVAYASFISMVLFNFSKLVFIYKKFRLLPFDANFLKLALVFAITVAIIRYLPETGNNLFNLVYKTGLYIVVNVVVVYKLRLVFQVNQWTDKLLMRVRG